MRNPLRSEEDAFRFVLLTIGYFALIVIGSVINVWLGVAVFAALTGFALWRLFVGRNGEARPTRQAPASSPPTEYRILVVANEAVGGPELLREVESHAAGRRTGILVVCPALASPVERWTSAEDDARAAARARLDQSLASMRAVGLDVQGEVGDGDPVQAVEDALRTFRPDEVILATHPAGASTWLERDVVEKVRARFDLPLTHVVVAAAADRR